MSEHDITKHSRAAISTLVHPGKTWKEKVQEILIEIFIIVFAILLSMYVERVRERWHDQEIEKDFLVGLQRDLHNDLKQHEGDSTALADLYIGWKYFRNCGLNGVLASPDSMNKYMGTLLSTTTFLPNDGRFEGLKSSGQLNVIEDKALLNLILDLYQYRLKSLQLTTTAINENKVNFMFPYLQEKVIQKKDGSSNLAQLFLEPRVQNYLVLGNAASEATSRYHIAMELSRKIIGMIDEKYHLDKTNKTEY